jgi:hypothetical protein
VPAYRLAHWQAFIAAIFPGRPVEQRASRLGCLAAGACGIVAWRTLVRR